MKSRSFLPLLMALFISGSMFAGTPLEDKLVLKGEFSQIGTRNEVPIVNANFSEKVLCVEFSVPVDAVKVTVKEATQKAYSSSSSTDATVSGQAIAIPVENYKAGTYTIEFRDSEGGYVYGEFTLM